MNNQQPPCKQTKSGGFRKIIRVEKRPVRQQKHAYVCDGTVFSVPGVHESYIVKYVNEQFNCGQTNTSPQITTIVRRGTSLPTATYTITHKRPQQIFTNAQEKELSEFVRDASDYYNGLTSRDVRILAFVYSVYNQVDLPAGWRDKHEATFAWCLSFTRRNKLSLLMVAGNSS